MGLMVKNMSDICDVKAISYVKNSENKSGQLTFTIVVNISEMVIKYIVEMFKEGKKDYSFKQFDDYDQAVDEYNLLYAKWSIK